MIGRASDTPGPSVGEELRETRRRGSPAAVGTAVRPSHNNLAASTGCALPGFLKRRSGCRGQQQQRQHESGSLPGMDARPSALRMALQGGGGDIARLGNEPGTTTNDPHHLQQRRRGGPGDEIRRRDSTTTNAGSWEFREPAQPRGSSPVSRPPSVRQRQGELNVSQSRGAGRASSDNATHEAQAFDSRESVAGRREATSGGRAASRDGVVDASMASFGRGGIGGGKGRAAAQARSSIRATGANVGSNGTTGAYRIASLAESSSSSSSSTRRGSGGAVGGNPRGSTNNQAEDIMRPGSTPRRMSSSSGRATSRPSGSPYQEAGFHRADLGSGGCSNSRGGGRRINRKGELDDRAADSAYSRRPSCDVGNKRRDSSQHDRGQGDGGGGGFTRGSPSMAPSGSTSTELDRRLPSIDGLDINGPTENFPGGEQAGGQGDEENMTPPSSSSLMRQRRVKDSPGNGSGGRFSSLAATEQYLPAQGGLRDEASGQLWSSNNSSEDRREGGGKEHAGVGVSGSSGGSRMDHDGYNNSGDLVAPGDSNSGGDAALQARRMVGTSGGGGSSVRNNNQQAGRGNTNCATDAGGSNIKNSLKSSSVRNNSVSTSRECLVGLQNLGNTCFMNACLQCLLHTDALVDLFRRRLHREQRLSSHNNKSPTRGALAEAFGELVALVEASPAHSNVSPAQEFLRFFLDGLAEDLNRRDSGGHQRGARRTSHQQDELGAGRGGGGEGGEWADHQRRAGSPPPPPVVPPMSDEEISRLTAEQQADRAWALHLARNDSEITSMFCGQLQSRISCLTCGNVSFCFDPFFDLSVPLPSDSNRGRGAEEGDGLGGRDTRGSYSSGGSSGGGGGAGGRSSTSGRPTTTLEDCLRAFSTEEALDGDNRPVCTLCRRRRKSAKSLAVHRFPPILVIHLKRFQYNSTSRTKLSTAVDFPIGSGLDLLPYSTPAARPTSPGSASSSNSVEDDDAGFGLEDIHRPSTKNKERAPGGGGGGGGGKHAKKSPHSSSNLGALLLLRLLEADGIVQASCSMGVMVWPRRLVVSPSMTLRVSASTIHNPAPAAAEAAAPTTAAAVEVYRTMEELVQFTRQPPKPEQASSAALEACSGSGGYCAHCGCSGHR
eukprot:g13373.t1